MDRVGRVYSVSAGKRLIQMQLSTAIPSTVRVKKIPRGFLASFPTCLGIFRPNFTCLLYVPVYARLQIFIQLPASLTKLCHIKRDHPVHIIMHKMSTILNACWHFLTFSPNSWEFLIQILCLLDVHIYARRQIFYSIISNCDEVMPY